MGKSERERKREREKVKLLLEPISHVAMGKTGDYTVLVQVIS